MLVDRDREVPAELIDQLCEVATWAPNHKSTWPWKFASCTGEARLPARRGVRRPTWCERDFGDEGKRTKTRRSTPGRRPSVVVGCEPHDEPHRSTTRTATPSRPPIQNILLGATAAGLASFWSTPPLIDSAHASSCCGFEPDDRIVGTHLSRLADVVGRCAGATHARRRPPRLSGTTAPINRDPQRSSYRPPRRGPDRAARSVRIGPAPRARPRRPTRPTARTVGRPTGVGPSTSRRR